MPFEIHEMRAKPDGFELTFTQARRPGDRRRRRRRYKLKTYTYIFQADYGSPEVDHTDADDHGRRRPPPTASSVRLKVDGLQIGHIHDLQLPGVKSAETGKGLLHPSAYYTLWNLAEGLS